MRIRSAIILVIAAAALSACGDSGVTNPPPPTGVLLKDVVIPNLPSPYYHFEYDAAGKILAASFASGARNYNLTYDGGRLTEMKNAGNQDRLDYVYDNAGRVSLVKYTDVDGTVFTTLFFTYSGQKLTEIERDRRVTGGFIIDKTMMFSYYPDGNVSEITEHHPAIDGVQTEATYTDRYEQYDDKLNVDGFSLIHTEFFDHLVLLPGVQLQKNNPARVTHTGDGDNYVINYTYYFDGSNRPLDKVGDLLFTTGPNAGVHFGTASQFSYY